MVAPAIAAALISGGTSLLGSLFGKKKTQTTRTNFTALRDDAIAAGFNPLTALRATGGGGNTTTTLPSLSPAEVIANAVQQGAGAYFAHDPHKEQRDKLELDLMRADLHNLQSPQNYGGTSLSGNIPIMNGSGNVRGEQPALGAPGGFEAAPSTVTNPYLNSAVDENYSDAAAAEERYGDILSNVFGARNAVVDLWANVPQEYKGRWGKDVTPKGVGLLPVTKLRSNYGTSQLRAPGW